MVANHVGQLQFAWTQVFLTGTTSERAFMSRSPWRRQLTVTYYFLIYFIFYFFGGGGGGGGGEGIELVTSLEKTKEAKCKISIFICVYFVHTIPNGYENNKWVSEFQGCKI